MAIWQKQGTGTDVLESVYDAAAKNERFVYGLAFTTQWINKAEERTNAVFQKTRQNWQGVQNLGKSLLPGSNPAAKKKSWLDVLMPKQPVETGPATMGEFLNMKRPGF